MRSVFSFVLAVQLLSAAACQAQQDGDPVCIGAYRTIHSPILQEERTLLVHLPDGYDGSAASYPVFYMLYGDQTETYYAECVSVLSEYASSGRIPPMILVAVTNTDRYRDLVPFDRAGNETGIDNFIAFFEHELIPWIDEQYRTKEYRVLLGPQAGANFALYTLFTNPELFNAFIINNPFRWESGRNLFLQQAETYVAEHDRLHAFVFVTHDASDELERQGNLYLEKLQAIVDKRRPQGFTLVRNYLPENDDFISPLGVREGLKALFRGYRMPEDGQAHAITEILTYYRDLSATLGFEVDVPGLVLSLQSDKLIQEQRENEAVEMCEYMFEHHLHAVDACWRLADIAVKREDYRSAEKYLGKMLEIFHGDTGMIKRRYEWVMEKLAKTENK